MKKTKTILAFKRKFLTHTIVVDETLKEGDRAFLLTATSEELIVSQVFRADFKNKLSLV